MSSRMIPHVLVMLYGRSRALVESDVLRWAQIFRMEPPVTTWQQILTFIHLMTFTPEFRNVFYLRVGMKSLAFAWMCPRIKGLDIVARSIGPGLFIQHGESTFVSAESIGANCWIGRHVVVGFSNETDRPTIGNNVRIFAGAKIIGDITIGDNATIGLNTVITQNVAPGLTMLGVPGKIIWRTAEPVPSQPALCRTA